MAPRFFQNGHLLLSDTMRDMPKFATVSLSNRFASSAHIRRVLSIYGNTHFSCSRRSLFSFLGFMEEKKADVECFQRERAEAALIRKIETETPKIELMRRIMAEQMIDDTVINETMNKEWGIVKNSGILDGMIPDEEQAAEIRKFFTRYYVELSK